MTLIPLLQLSAEDMHLWIALFRWHWKLLRPSLQWNHPVGQVPLPQFSNKHVVFSVIVFVFFVGQAISPQSPPWSNMCQVSPAPPAKASTSRSLPWSRLLPTVTHATLWPPPLRIKRGKCRRRLMGRRVTSTTLQPATPSVRTGRSWTFESVARLVHHSSTIY